MQTLKHIYTPYKIVEMDFDSDLKWDLVSSLVWPGFGRHNEYFSGSLNTEFDVEVTACENTLGLTSITSTDHPAVDQSQTLVHWKTCDK